MPNAEDVLRRIDLLLARKRIADPDARAAGVDALRVLISSPRLDELGADAAMLLAETLAADNEREEANALYRRVAAAQLGERSELAARLSQEAARAALAIDLIGPARPDQPLHLELSGRDTGGVRLELRRVDLGRFLTESQGNLNESQLPDDGALAASETIDAPPQGAWRRIIDVEATSGALVAIARASGNTTISGKRLIVASDLAATAITGNSRVLLAVAPGPASARARFWMQGSFVPTQIEMPNGTAAFPLPAEARLLRDRRWTCLFERGDQVSLVRGELCEPVEGAARRVLLSAGPDEARVGEEVSIVGMLLGDEPDLALRPLDVELHNTMDNLRAKSRVQPDRTGVFAVRTRVGPEMAGEQLSIVVRQGNTVLPFAYHNPVIRVAEPGSARTRVSIQLASVGSDSQAVLFGSVRAMQPWGLPLTDAYSLIGVHAVRLPDSPLGQPGAHTAPASFRARLDSSGRYEFVQPMGMFSLPDGATALDFHANISTPDQRTSEGSRQMLLADEPAHVWIDVAPPAVQVGQQQTFAVGWFDPDRLALGESPTLEIQPPEGEFRPAALSPGSGGTLITTTAPSMAGDYRLRAMLKLADGRDVSLERVLHVNPNPAAGTLAIRRAEAVLRSSPSGSEIRVDLALSRPGSVLLAALGPEPLAAAWFAEAQGTVRMPLPDKGRTTDCASVAIYALEGGTLVALGAVPAIRRDAPTITISDFAAPPAPGGMTRLGVTARGRDLAGATLVGRTSTTDVAGPVDWLSNNLDFVGAARWAPVRAYSAGGGIFPMPLDPPLIPPACAPELLVRLLGSGTYWADRGRVEGERGLLAASWPARPEVYRLQVIAIWPDGMAASADRIVDMRQAVDMAVDLPATMCVGDRTVAAIRLENRSAREVTGSLQVETARGLACQALRLAAGDGRLTQGETPGQATITLAPLAEVFVWAPSEAMASGRAIFGARFSAGEKDARAEGTGRILSAPRAAITQPGGCEVRIRRQLFRLAPEPAEPEPRDPADIQLEKRGYSKRPRIPLTPDDPLPPGTLVMVEETIDIVGGPADAVWIQPAPATAAHVRDTSREWRTIGTPLESTAERAAFDAKSLSAGQRVHEYMLVVQRPGDCRLPWPELSGAIRLEVVPETTRVRAADRVQAGASGQGNSGR
ncbi:MAG: hypothetical protein HZB38_06295 [Planctomycetes bacterium]|nr:hypothetical protein [Planctomycetota bacterium]